MFDMVPKAPFMVSIDFECFLVSKEQLVLAVPLSLKRNQFLQQMKCSFLSPFSITKYHLIFYVNCLLLADDSHQISSLIFSKIKALKDYTKIVVC